MKHRRCMALALLTPALLALAHCASLHREHDMADAVDSLTIPHAETLALPDSETRWPLVACTPDELVRLRAAWHAGSGAAYDAVAPTVERAASMLGSDINFPPEGGQHNQWYQCDVCQIALETVDDTHHRCPQCETVYSGYPYDQVIYERQHYRLTRDLIGSAWAYALTEDERYAARARDLLVGYGERYARYPYHSANQGTRDTPVRDAGGGHVFEQSLNEAVWTHDIARAYDLIRRSDALSPEDHETIRQGLFRPLAASIFKHRAGKSNWQTYHNSAFLYLGGLLGDVEMVRDALFDPDNGFYHQMEVSVLPGGMWYENSWSYHFYTLSAIERTLETARRLGLDLYAAAPVKDMYTVAFDYRMADGTLPRFGDATTTGIQARHIPTAYHAWRDLVFEPLLPDEPTWDTVMLGLSTEDRGAAPAAGSLLLRGPGHGILRMDGPHGPASAVLAFGPFGGFHGHFDKLSFVHFALGTELAYDPGRARSQAYRLPVHRNWYRATISHNTVLVDRVSQEGAAGQATLFHEGPELAAVAARTSEAYDGIEHRRMLALRPQYLLVVDELISLDGSSRLYDWLYHQRGETVDVDASMQSAEVADAAPGFDYIEDAKTGVVDRAVRATFGVGADRAIVTVDATGDARILTGTGVGESVTDRVPLLFVTREGAGAHFAAVVEPVPDRSEPTVDGVQIEASGDGRWVVQVRLRDGSTDWFDVDATGGERAVQGRTTCAVLACVSTGPAGERWLAEVEALAD